MSHTRTRKHKLFIGLGTHKIDYLNANCQMHDFVQGYLSGDVIYV